MFDKIPDTAAVYCRVSSEYQQERQTIKSQVDFAEKYCELNNIRIIKMYCDDGVTGTMPMQDRPAGADVLADAKAGKFPMLLIFKLDRLGRSTRVILNAVHDLDGLGVKVRSMTEPFDTSDASGRFLLTILAGVADLERSNILQRMDLGATRAAEAGKWLGGIVPYGYFKNDQGFIEPNNEPIPGFELSEVDVVRMIYRMCVEEGKSTPKISDHLNALKIPPAWVAHNLGGKRRNNTRGIWTSSRILGILKATTYKGIHEYGKRSPRARKTILRAVPAIVDTLTWERAQKILKSNMIDSMKNAKHKYLLKSIVKCENCGATYRGNAAGPKCKDGYYSCGGRANWRRMERREKCHGMSINMRWLDDFVWNDCLRYINHPELILDSIDAMIAKTENINKQKSQLNIRIDELSAERDKMLTLYRKSMIEIDELKIHLDRIKKDRESIESELAELADKEDPTNFFAVKETAISMLGILKSTIERSDVDFDVKQGIIRSMIRNITVCTDDSGKRAKITLHYQFDENISSDFIRTATRKGMDSWPL